MIVIIIVITTIFYLSIYLSIYSLLRTAQRYEIGLRIRTGNIVWAYEGFPCGEYSDLKLARSLYIHQVYEDEMTLADDGYKDRDFFIYPYAYSHSSQRQKEAMARHETVNG